MSDLLPVIVVVPKGIEASEQIGVAIKTTEAAFQSAGWDVRLKHKIVPIDVPDGAVYDADAFIRSNLVSNGSLRALATQAHGGGKRTAYVIFVCKKIVTADNAQTKFTTAAGTNGESVSDEAISFIALMEPKKAIGSGDGRTWTHEIGHGLGLRHVDDNESNLMSPNRHGNTGKLTGFELTEIQVKTMQTNLKTLVTTGI